MEEIECIQKCKIDNEDCCGYSKETKTCISLENCKYKQNRIVCESDKGLEKQLNGCKELCEMLKKRKDFLERKLADKKKPHFYEVSPRILLDIEARLDEIEDILRWIDTQKIKKVRRDNMEEYTIEPFKNYMGETMYKLVEIKENGTKREMARLDYIQLKDLKFNIESKID